VSKGLDGWDPILSWCFMASQQDMEGISPLALSVDMVTEGNNAYFGCWIENHLDSTLGPCPTAASVGAIPTGATQPLDANPGHGNDGNGGRQGVALEVWCKHWLVKNS
jgi:hypothetical protein